MWLVKHGDETTSYDKTQLVAMLVHTMMKQTIDSHQKDISDEVVVLLANGGGMPYTSIAEMLELGFRAGYLYRIFLEKNNVVLPEAPTAATQDSAIY